MPLVEFECPNCRNVIEKLFSTFAESDPVEKIPCTKCAHSAMRKIGTPALHFKGAGWTEKFHKPFQSHIAGVPVSEHSDPRQVAKDVATSLGGAKGIVNNAEATS